MVPPGGGGDLVCDCELGYQGTSCEDTVNWGVEFTTDPECVGRHHRAADPSFHLRQTEAEAEEESQVLRHLSGVSLFNVFPFVLLEGKLHRKLQELNVLIIFL